MVGLYMLFIFLFLYVGDYNDGREFYNLSISIDNKIPFNPHFVWTYILYYFVALMPVMVVNDIHEFRRMVGAYLMMYFMGFLTFILFPVKMVRPELIGDGYSLWLLKKIYNADNGYNCFPSMHVANAFLASFFSFRFNRIYGMVVYLIAFLITISTLFIKQHYVMDLVAGILLAYFVYRFSYFRFSSEKVISELKKLREVIENV
jgi:membrane-associated phospholipid phosphatase